MKKNFLTLLFPLFFSIIPPFLYLILNAVNLNSSIIKFSIFIYFINLGWISFIHLYKKNQTLILSIYLIISIIVSTYFVFFELKNNLEINEIQYKIIYSLLLTGIIGLSFFIKRKKKKGEI